jgi:hypothetical protein
MKSHDTTAVTSTRVAFDSRRRKTGQISVAVSAFAAAIVAWISVPFAQSQTTPPPLATQFGTTAFMSFRDADGSFPFARPLPADRAIILDEMRRMGLHHLREAIMQWGEAEPHRGAGYDFSLMDDLVRKAAERNIQLLGIFTGLPLWATGGTAGQLNMMQSDPRTFAPKREFEGDFRRFVRAAVRRYGNTPDRLPGLRLPIRHWEFYNEVDAGWFQEPDDYAYWLKAFTEEVRRADPSAKVLTAGFASVAVTVARPPHRQDPAYLEKLLKSPNLQGPGFPYFDVLNIHNYPVAYGGTPITGDVLKEFTSRNPTVTPTTSIVGYEPLLASLDVMMAYVRRVMAIHQINLPVWLTEIGDNSQFTGPEEHASRLVKYYVHAASVGFARVYQFCLYDLGLEPGQGEWGIMKLTVSGQRPPEKPAYVATATFLSHFKRVERVSFVGPGVYRLELDTDEEAFWIWKAGDRAVLPRELTGQLRVIDLKGNERRIKADGLEVSRAPQLVYPSRPR